MKRLSRRRAVTLSGILAAGLAAIAAMGLWWAVSTQGGARWTFERLGAAFPGEIQVGSMRGPMRGPLEIRGLLYRTDRTEVLVDRLSLDWRLGALVRRRLDVRDLVAEGVHIKLLGGAQRPRDSLAAELPDMDLPMDVMIGRGRIRGIDITPVGGDSAYRIDEVNLSDAAFRDTLTIGSLVVHSPRADLELTGRGHTRGRYAVDLDVVWAYRTFQGRETRGRGRLVGNLDTLRVRQSLTGAFAGDFDGFLYRPLRELTFRGDLGFIDLELQDLGPGWPEARTSGRLAVSGNLARFDARGRVDATLPTWGRWNADVDADRDTTRVMIRRLVMTAPGRDSRVVAEGAIVTSGSVPHLDLRAQWQALALPVGARHEYRSPEGTLHLSGPATGYRIAGDAVVTYKEMPATRWRVRGTGNPRRTDFQSIAGDAFGGSVTGKGSVDWAHPMGWDFTLAARGVNPATAYRGWPGDVAFDLATHGRWAGDAVTQKLVVEGLTGQVRGRPVSGRGSATLSPGSTSISAAELAIGPNRLTASGDIGRAWNLAWHLDAHDLSFALPRGGGALVMDGTITGSHPRVQATLEGDSLRWTDARLERLTGSADLDFGRGGQIQLDLAAAKLDVGGRPFSNASVTARGTREEHGIEVSAASDDSMRAGARGGIAGRSWTGFLTRLDLVTKGIGNWTLDHEAPLAVDASGATLRGFSGRSGESRVEAEAVWRREGSWSLDSRLDKVQLGVLDPALPASIDLTGTTSGTVALRRSEGRILGDAHLDVGPGEIGYPASGGRRGASAIRPSVVRLHAGPEGVDSHLLLALAADDTILAFLRTPHASPAARGPLAGTLHVRLRDLGPLQGFVPDLAGARGELRADLRVEGSGGRPRWQGDAQLAGAAAELPRFGIQLVDVNVTARSDASGHLELQGGARSGPGHIALRGDATFTPGGMPVANLTLEGQQFQAANTPDARVLVSPDVRVALRGDSLGVVGEVLVPEADVLLKRPAAAAVNPSPDVVFVDTLSDERARRATLRVQSEIRMTLGRSVRVRGFGIDARPAGSILVIDRPGLPTSATGELHLTQGTYRLYGRVLELERGRMIFAGGPIMNPSIEARASRRARDGVVAGFEVQGTLEAPRLSVFSEPAMAERDALAYVVLGRRIEHASELEQGLVGEAASELGLRGGTYIASTIAQQLGIDEATIESEGTFEDASLMLGTYLSPRLYVNYGVGIVDPVTLRVQYFLGSKWTLLAETGSESRGEILYTVER